MTDHEVKVWNNAIKECSEYLQGALKKRRDMFGDNPRYDLQNHWLIVSLNTLYKKNAGDVMNDKLEAIRKILES